MRTPEEIGKSLTSIVVAINSVRMEELDAMLGNINRDGSIGPLLDPTAWQEGMFQAATQTKHVMQAIRDFKVEVSGIGNFATVVVPK